jgi:hypothetical protein
MSLPTYRSLCLLFAVAVFSTSFANYSLRWGVRPLDWIFLLLAIAAPVMLALLLGEGIHLPPVTLWCAGYLAISILWYVPSPQDELAFQEIQTRLLSVAFIVVLSVLLARPREQRIAKAGIAGATGVAASLNLYELFNPLTFSTIPGRSSGLFANVNQSGAALVLGLIVGFDAVPRWLRPFYVALLGAGVVSTFSRSAMMGFVLALLYLAIRDGLRTGLVLRAAAVFAIATIVIYSPVSSRLEESLESRGVLTLNVIDRIAFFTTGRVTEQSASERQRIASEAWRAYTERPLAGWGLSASHRFDDIGVGTHNIYLAMMVDHGILGLLIAPSLAVLALWGASRDYLRRTGIPFLCFFLFWGLFSHNILEERHILLVVALVAATTAAEGRRAQESAPVVAPSGAGLARLPA